MKINISIVVGVVLSFTQLVNAQESSEQAVQRMAALGVGIHDVKKDEKGALKSLKVVGQERVSTVLGAAKGMIAAQKRAEMKANAEFIKWMQSNVKSISTLNDESIIMLAGDGNTLSEQGKAEEKTAEQITQMAEGLIKGLKLVGKDVDNETGLLTLVYSWSTAGVQLANEAKEANNRSSSNSSNAPPVEGGKTTGGYQKKTTVSPDFDE